MKRYFFLVAITIFSVLSVTAQTGSDVEFLNSKNWSQLGKPVEGPRGFVLFTRDLQSKGDDLFSFWLKIVPAEPSIFARRYSLPRETAVVLQYTRVDCKNKTVNAAEVRAFTEKMEPVDLRGSSFVRDGRRGRASIVNETAFEFICSRLE